MKKRCTFLLTTIIVAALALAACGNSPDDLPANGEPPQEHAPGETAPAAPQTSEDVPEATLLAYASSEFSAVYRTGVVAFAEPPRYSYVVDADNTAVITVHNATAQMRELQAGDTFVLEPTIHNISGIAGHVLHTAASGDDLVITAQLPTSLDEVFYEFATSSAADLIALGGEIVMLDEFADLGFAAERNPDTMYIFEFNLAFPLDDIPTAFRGPADPLYALNGEMHLRINLYRPIISHDIRFSVVDGLDIQHFEFTAGASFEAYANITGTFDEVVTFAVYFVRLKGVLIEIPLSVRIIAEGSAHVMLQNNVEFIFGYRENERFSERNNSGGTISHRFDFARTEIGLQIGANIWPIGFVVPPTPPSVLPRAIGLELVGFTAGAGFGFNRGDAAQEECPLRECRVIETNVMLRAGINDSFGVGRFLPPIEWDHPVYTLARFMFNQDGESSRYCLCE